MVEPKKENQQEEGQGGDDDDGEDRSSRIDKLLLVFASASIFLYGGAFYGWGPMQLLLEDNGNFAGKCEHYNEANDQEEVCEEQTAALLNVRFYSQLTLFASPLLGIVSDRWGATAICLSMAIFAIAGAACLVVASAITNLDWMLFVAFCLLGLASTGYGLMTVETGLVFSGKKMRSRVISGMNALFDAGAVTYWGLWGIAELLDEVALTSLAGSYLVLAILCLGGFWYLFRTVTLQRRENIGGSKADEVPDTTAVSMVSARDESTADGKIGRSNNDSGGTVLAEHSSIDKLSSETNILKQGGNESSQSEVESTVAKSTEVGVEEASNTTNTADDEKAAPAYIRIADRPFRGQVTSQLFIMLAIFFSFHQTSNIWTLTTARDFLKYLGDDDYGNRYLTIFTLLTPVSLMGLPFVDVAIHKYGFHVALQGVNLLSILHGIIKVAFTNLNVQIVGFVIFSFFRCFLFSVSLSCLPSFVNPNATGRAVSTLYCVSGALTFLNIPFASLALEQGEGNFFLPNLLYLLMTLPMIFVTWLIGRGLDRDGKAAAKA